jgi:hypothetical protein
MHVISEVNISNLNHEITGGIFRDPSLFFSRLYFSTVSATVNGDAYQPKVLVHGSVLNPLQLKNNST